ncbi:MAG: restriction endonuclease [Deltaproteobacteria bacterium]|nr:restriction endonuclease [Deltaproteobacteria bacterium]
MNIVSEFRVGEHYTNDQIRFSLKLENLGGIRPSISPDKTLRLIAIMTAAEESRKLICENPYRDRIEDNVLIFTAQGREGDQQLSGRNKRLIEQYVRPIPFYGFINEGNQTYRFLGLLELLRHYQELQADRRRTLRKVWLFEFKIHQLPDVVPIDQASIISATILSESLNQNPLAYNEREVTDLPGEEKQPDNPEISYEIEDLRGCLLKIPPYNFEHLIKKLMEESGFSDVCVTSASGDGGIDINAYVNIVNDFFGGTHVQAQIKRWRHAVGSVEINKFRGALSATAKGVFITTSHYTRASIVEANHNLKPCITLIDGKRLSRMIIKSNLDIGNYY